MPIDQGGTTDDPVGRGAHGIETARAYHRMLKLSRTIADLAGCEQIEVPHLAEALQYRRQTMFA